MNILHKQTLYINSKNRLSGSATSFSFYLDIDRSQQFDRVSVIDVLVPKSYYNIGNTNNKLTVSENSVVREISLTIGNYSRKSFRAVLQTALNTSPHIGYSYAVSYDSSSSLSDNGKYTFTVETSGNPQPTFIFTEFQSPLAQIGFDSGTKTFSGDIIISENVVNFRPKNRLILKSDILQNFNNNTLQNIISTEGDFDYISFQNATPIENYKDFVQTSSNIYNFTLLDEELKGIDLNGLHWSCTIILWKENRISELIKTYIQTKVLKGS